MSAACTRNGQGRGLRLQISGGGVRGAAHVKHGDHGRDARGVPAQGLVEGPRLLPRVASRAHGAGRAARVGRREAASERGLHAAGRGEGCDCRDQGRSARGAQRTRNMLIMFVTREVSQLRGWLKAYAACRGSQAGHTVRGGLPAGRREAAGDRGGARSGQGRGLRLQRSGAKRAGSSTRQTWSACS